MCPLIKFVPKEPFNLFLSFYPEKFVYIRIYVAIIAIYVTSFLKYIHNYVLSLYMCMWCFVSSQPFPVYNNLHFITAQSSIVMFCY